MKKFIAAILMLFAPAVYADEMLDQFQVGVFDLVVDATGEVEDRFFYYNGPISSLSSDILEDAFKRYPDVKLIALNSPGGVAVEADELGQLFSDNKIRVWVPTGRYCMSACANAFIGGWDYKVEGILGFHSSWLPEEYLQTLTPEQFNSMYSAAQYSGTHDVHYWAANGFSIQLPATINGYTSVDTFLTFLSEDELMEYYVRIDDDYESERVDQLQRYMSFPVKTTPRLWSNAESGPYLQAQMNDLIENGTRHAVYVDTIYDPFEETENETNEEG